MKYLPIRLYNSLKKIYRFAVAAIGIALIVFSVFRFLCHGAFGILQKIMVFLTYK